MCVKRHREQHRSATTFVKSQWCLSEGNHCSGSTSSSAAWCFPSLVLKPCTGLSSASVCDVALCYGLDWPWDQEWKSSGIKAYPDSFLAQSFFTCGFYMIGEDNSCSVSCWYLIYKLELVLPVWHFSVLLCLPLKVTSLYTASILLRETDIYKTGILSKFSAFVNFQSEVCQPCQFLFFSYLYHEDDAHC